MAQFLHSKTVVNRILFVGKTWNFTKKDSIKDLTLLVKYIKSCTGIIIKTSKCWLLYCQLWKCSEVIEAAARSCSLKKVLSKIFKNSQENTSARVSVLKNKIKREKKERQVFFRELYSFFSELGRWVSCKRSMGRWSVVLIKTVNYWIQGLSHLRVFGFWPDF